MTFRLAITAAALGLVAAALPTLVDAQSAPQPVILVRAGKLFNSEAGRMVGPRDILIQGERVAEVGQELTAPAGATVIDLRRCSVLPGLIDAHIRPRAFADLVAVEGDPTQDLVPLRTPRIVIKSGRVVVGESLACAAN